MRVVIRYRVGSDASDALGTVLEAGEDFVTVDTKRGPVRIDTGDVILVHEIPPAPQRSGPLHEIVSAADVRRIAANVWLPSDATWLNADNLRGEQQEDAEFVQTGWLLRSARGASLRADSVLPLTAPGISPLEALELTEKWYAQRSQQPAVQIYSAAGSTELAPICAELAAHFRDQGYTPSRPTLALTAATREVAAGLARPAEAALPGLAIVESEDVHDIHYAAWGRPSDHPHHAEFAHLLHSGPQLRFFSAVAEHPGGSRTLVGAVRLAVSNKWAVISELVVDPSVRRRGAGRALVRAAAAAAAERGIRSLLAEVEADNDPARELFTSLGATEHHRCWFAVRG
jgi:N-acetylglutamate synthase